MKELKISAAVITIVMLGLLQCAGSNQKNYENSVMAARHAEGRRLFDEETFGGNGRTCVTCHSVRTGTISPEDVKARFALNSADPLFTHDGLDDDDNDGSPDQITTADPSNVERIIEHATIRVEIPLPSNVWLMVEGEDGELVRSTTFRKVVFNRGVPSTINTPALDPALMYDGRAPNLQEQALGAIQGHAQNVLAPTREQLDLIAEFQQTDRRFFSSKKLAKFAADKKPPKLPKGATPSEKRGRAMFDDVPIDPDTKAGICAICHSGPMLNEFNEHNPFGAPPGARFGEVQVSQRNLMGNPLYTFEIDEADGSVSTVTTPDPGVMLTVPLPPDFPPFLPRAFAANFFKIPQLWGVADTAPYFHDNSAKTLEDVAEQYDFFFNNHPVFNDPESDLHLVLTDQDLVDMVAFMELLDGRRGSDYGSDDDGDDDFD